ncbi:MAG TPA: PQQ-binding-like beta-propeller repeat protein [Vicinamibacteria bacterium]|jgi:outer membrane protein assembly factor BamB
MSAGSAPVRGALFALVVVHLGAVSSPARQAAADPPRFRLKWLSDLGADVISTPRAAALAGKSTVAAQVAGAGYFLSPDIEGRLSKEMRIPADFSSAYDMAASPGGAVVANGEGSVGLWSWLDGRAPRLQWRKDVGGRVMSVGWDGGVSLWIGTRDDRLVALSTTDGKELWSTAIQGRAEGPAVRENDSLFVATKAGALFRIDATSGKVKWKVELPGPALHPPVFSGRDPRLVVCGTWNGHLSATDASTGKSLWSVELGSRLAGAPASGESFVAAATEDGAVSVYGLDGQQRFRSERAASGATDLVVQGGSDGPVRLIVVSSFLKALDPETGATLADYPEGAVQEIQKRFLDAMLEGDRAYSESEKAAILAKETFPVQGRLFGEARLFGDRLVFATEEGFIYSFDALSLRPLSRYRAGQYASARPLVSKGTLVAVASDEIFGLDPDSGRTRWSRDVSGVKDVVAGPSLVVLGEDRFDVLDPTTGARQWSATGEFEAVLAIAPAAAENGPSFVTVARSGAIRAFDGAGRSLEGSLELGREIAVAAATSGRSFAVATRDGRVSALDWETGLRPGWEATLSGPIQGLSYSNERVILPAGQRVVGLASSDGSPSWDLSLEAGETLHVESDAIFLLGSGTLRVFDIASGELRFSRAVPSPAVGAAFHQGALVWLDASGRAHRAASGDGGEDEPVDLDILLSQAIFDSDRFLVTTEAGEVGLVELVEPQPAAVVPQ